MVGSPTHDDTTVRHRLNNGGAISNRGDDDDEVVLGWCDRSEADSAHQDRRPGSSSSYATETQTQTSSAQFAVYDPSTGAATSEVFRDAEASPSRVALVRDRYLVVPHATKPAILVWEWGKETPAHTCYVAERVACLCADAGGAYVVAGGKSGTIYAWLMETGEFLCSWKAHYRPVTSVDFVPGQYVFVSAGEDALVHAWNLAELVVSASGRPRSSSTPKPLATWSEHSLPVTSLFCAEAGGADAVFATASLDHTCKLWRLDRDGRSLCTVSCPSPLLCCCLDPLEDHLYAGGRDGGVFEKRLAEVGREAAGVSHAVSRTFVGHDGPVTSVACSSDGASLITTSEDGVLYVWNRGSGERLRSIQRENPIKFATVLRCGARTRSGAHRSMPGGPLLLPFKKYRSPPGEESEVGVRALPDAMIDRARDLLKSNLLTANSGADRAGASVAAKGKRKERDGEAHEEAMAVREELERVRDELQKKDAMVASLEGKILDLLQAKNAL